MIKLLLLAVIALTVIAILMAILARKMAASSQAGENANADVYYLRKAVFTPAERSFLGVLESMLSSDELRVFGKVRLEDIFGIKKGLEPAARTTARNRINRKHVDFLLVRADDLSPVLGIELDDSSHDAENRQERDAFVDSVFASGRLPLLHILAQASYNAADIQGKVMAALQSSATPGSN